MPSTAIAAANCPVYSPLRKVASTPNYGLHLAKKNLNARFEGNEQPIEVGHCITLFVGYYMSLSFQQNWFHLVWSSDAQVITVLVLAENMFLSAFTGCTAHSPVEPASAYAHR